MRVLGIDPGYAILGWGVLDVEGNRFRVVAYDSILTDKDTPMPRRLQELHEGLKEIIEKYKPEEAAIEKTFLNSNPETSLKLSMARGVVILSAGHYGIPLFEFEPNKVKKALVGVGHADKNQIGMMVKILLPGCQPKNNDSADALAMAITRSHYRTTTMAYK